MQDQIWQTYNRWKVDKNVDMFEVQEMEKHQMPWLNEASEVPNDPNPDPQSSRHLEINKWIRENPNCLETIKLVITLEKRIGIYLKQSTYSNKATNTTNQPVRSMEAK